MDHLILGDECHSILEESLDLKDKDLEKMKKDIIHELKQENISLKNKIKELEEKDGIYQKIQKAKENSKPHKKENSKSKEITI